MKIYLLIITEKRGLCTKKTRESWKSSWRVPIRRTSKNTKVQIARALEAEQADISLGYGYKLLTEEKTTRQRDVILRLCYGAQFTVAETQRALELCQLNRLYARDPRDALIMTCFNKRPGSVIDVNDILRKNKMEVLRPSGVQ